jgi:hypothetical protein
VSIKIAAEVANAVYKSWSPINKESAARNAFAMFCSLMRLDESEIEPGDGKVTLRAKARNGIHLEASGVDSSEALRRLLGKV